MTSAWFMATWGAAALFLIHGTALGSEAEGSAPDAAGEKGDNADSSDEYAPRLRSEVAMGVCASGICRGAMVTRTARAPHVSSVVWWPEISAGVELWPSVGDIGAIFTVDFVLRFEQWVADGDLTTGPLRAGLGVRGGLETEWLRIGSFLATFGGGLRILGRQVPHRDGDILQVGEDLFEWRPTVHVDVGPRLFFASADFRDAEDAGKPARMSFYVRPSFAYGRILDGDFLRPDDANYEWSLALGYALR